MQVNQPQEQITIVINKEEDLNKISGMQLDLVLPRSRKKASKHYQVSKTEPLLVYDLPAKIQNRIPIKKATVQVHSITVTLIRKKMVLRGQ